MENIFSKLVAFPSVTGDTQASHELVEYVADFVRRRGMHIERYISNGFESLVATSRAGDKAPAVMLAAHGDVVKAPPEQFVLRKADGKYYGRGVLDMKFALAAYLQIIDELQGNIQDYSLGLMLTMDEERGGEDGVALLLKEGYRPKVCLIPDGGDNWQVQTASKGVWVFDITAHGTSAHSSRHWEGDNALTKLLPIVPQLEALFPNQGIDTNTISINNIRAGGALTQVPDKAALSMDIRTINESEHKRLFEAVATLCRQHGFECSVVADGDPTYFDLHDPYIQPYVDLIEEVVGVKVTGTKTLASNDARFFTPHNIPCISLYPTGGEHHSSKEWIDAQAFEDFKNITQQYLEIVARL